MLAAAVAAWHSHKEGTMAAYLVEEQELAEGQAAALTTSIGCPRGCALHDNGSPIINLRGPAWNSNQCFARYDVEFTGNIWIPEGGTPAPVAVGIAAQGQVSQYSVGAATPAAVEEPSNVACRATITVPKGNSYPVSLVRTIPPIGEAATPPAELTAKGIVTVTRTA